MARSPHKLLKEKFDVSGLQRKSEVGLLPTETQ
jgi:hypothetical protein